MPLEETIVATRGQLASASVYNNAAQAWNHAFYRRSPRPDGAGVKAVLDKAAALGFAADNLG